MIQEWQRLQKQYELSDLQKGRGHHISLGTSICCYSNHHVKHILERDGLSGSKGKMCSTK